MRTLLFFLLLAPVFTSAQINRSASELARETTKDFVVKKLFPGQVYNPVSYSEAKPYTEKDDLHIEWMIEHKFEISRSASSFDKNTDGLRKPYKFIFYLDKQMKVRRAESYSKS
jgi:hypothetical protein